MFNFFKRKNKEKPVAGEIGEDEFASSNSNETLAQTKEEKPSSLQTNANFAPKIAKNVVKEKTINEKAIEMIKNSELKNYYDLMEKTFNGKNTRDIVNGIYDEVSRIFAMYNIKINGNETLDEKLDYARKVFDHVVNNIEYDKILTQFMRVISKEIYHENINRELMKEVYYGLCNHAGTCLSNACTIAYMFEKIGLDAKVMGLENHAVVEVDVDGKKLYCDSTYEKGIVSDRDIEAIAQGKGYGAGFMKDEILLTDRNYHKGFTFPNISVVLEANAHEDELENSYTIDFHQ